jgi:hypothetical protein
MTIFTTSFILYTLHSMLYSGAHDTSPGPGPPPSTSLVQQFAARREAKPGDDEAKGAEANPKDRGGVQKSEAEQTFNNRLLGMSANDEAGIKRAKNTVGSLGNNLYEGNWNGMGEDTKDLLLNQVSSITGVPRNMWGLSTQAIVVIIIAQLAVVILLDLVLGWILYLIWKQNCMYRRRGAFPATQEHLKGDLAPAGFFGCFSFTVHHMLESIFCPWCLISENLEKEKPPRKREKEISFATVCCTAFLGKITCAVGDTCLWFCFCLPFYGIYGTCLTILQRLRLSKLHVDVRKKSETTCCTECVKVYVCTAPCGNMQVAEFLELEDRHFGGDPDETQALKPDGLRW